MAEIWTRQQQLQRSIDRFLENFKKIGRSNLTAAKIRSRISALRDLWQQFQSGNAVLLQSTPPAQQESLEYFSGQCFDQTEELYRTTLDHLTEALEELEPPVSPHNDSILNQNVRVSSVSLARLPPISLPPFDGNLDHWESFRDRFTSLIIRNPELNNFSRMHFLTSCLKGPALLCISNLPVTAANFDIAWQSLISRYENKGRLLQRHLSALLNLPTVTRESAAELQSLRDTVKIAVASLIHLPRSPSDLWSDILTHLVVQRLDASTRRAWSLKIADYAEPPSFSDLDRFLSCRVRAFDEQATAASSKPCNRSSPARRISAATASASASASHQCPICNARHFFSACPSFVRGTLAQRRELVKKHGRCYNCLSRSHSVLECTSKYSCRSCHQRHHSMLHSSSGLVTSVQEESSAGQSTPRDQSQAAVQSHLASQIPRTSSAVLLATARIKISGVDGRSIEARVLLDQGSEMTFISEPLAQTLRLKRLRMPTSVSAVGCVNAGTFRHAAVISVSPRSECTPTVSTTALILNSLTSYAPRRAAGLASLPRFSDLALADPDPTGSDPIQAILGADIYGAIILDGVIKGDISEPIAQNSIFGWILSGPLSLKSRESSDPDSAFPSSQQESHISALHCFHSPSLEENLQRFWEVEELQPRALVSPEEEHCEAHFLATHSRTEDGRYIVRLPFKTDLPVTLGNSRRRAEQQLHAIFRRLQTQPPLLAEYREFVAEYARLRHLRIAPCPAPSDSCVYLPHHPVFRESSTTTRVRVVFNASSLSSTGVSLNDLLMIGPKLQADLTTVLLRWRQFQFVYSADIAKMYRQILIDPRDLDFQRILWKESSNGSVIEYQLLTVTYGMACAPFLALRVLQQLAVDEGASFPLAVPILRNHIYIDDVLFGHEREESLRELRNQLVLLLRRGGFELRKWASNSSTLLSDIDSADHGVACSKSLSDSDTVNILGLEWSPKKDALQMHVSLTPTRHETKREILQAIARLYDPLGLVTPVILAAKLVLQQLWRAGVSWDERVPACLFDKWQRIYSDISCLRDVSIPRWTGYSSSSRAELHGFSDASNLAYAAVIYLRVVGPSSAVTVTLLQGKSKVAPLKTISIPRLELLGAVLLARLLASLREAIRIAPLDCFCWSDSTVVLSWLRHHPSRWQTFVANRVADIQSRLPGVEWRHVQTTDNPADCASRGLLGSELVSHPLWWHGPPWLRSSRDHWPNQDPTLQAEPPPESKPTSMLIVLKPVAWDLAERYSSWPRLLRITAYILRFASRCRRDRLDKHPKPSSGPFLHAREISSARLFWLKRIQSELFADEISSIRQNQRLSAKNPILALDPFLDQDGVLRVGGRLRRAISPAITRHPILLAAHSLVILIIANTHIRTLHGGLQLTLSTLRREFWVLRARSMTKTAIHRCLACTRERAATPTQRMGDLPSVRVTAPPRSFSHCGVDYAGPIAVRSSAGRGIKTRKAYIALFVCLASRAIHLELVADYTTLAFLNAFDRFCARRGLPLSVYSDNGTTFVGADRELKSAYRAALRDPSFQNRIVMDQVSWHFIPPNAPHFGGLWEAGVRSVKHHLRRVLGQHTLTFEEFTTLLCKIEACLNSRPLAPLSDNLDDFECLTPGHFLIGSPLITSPAPSILDVNENRLSRWQAVRHITERFWRLWYADYVNTLQQRSKWRTVEPNIRVDQLVLLKNANMPPCKWELARVVKTHPGVDGLTRVVTVRTASSEFTRPINRICVLPIHCDASPV